MELELILHNVIISSYKNPMDPKFTRVGWEDLTHKVTWHIDHVVTWNTKGATCPLSQGLCTPKLAGWWLRMRKAHPQVTWHINHVVTWKIRDISPLSQGLWIPNLARWWLRMKGPHTQSHVTNQSSGHVTNQKYFIFTFTRHMADKLSGPTCPVTPWSRCHMTTIH